MPQNDPQAEKSTKSKIPELFPGALAETGKRRVEDMIKLQAEVFEYLQKVNRNWVSRVQSEVAMASEFATKLAAARSIPDCATVCQEWANQRIELLAQDGKQLVADAEKFVEAGARVLGNGWAGNP